jgi:hypothetical protein
MRGPIACIAVVVAMCGCTPRDDLPIACRFPVPAEHVAALREALRADRPPAGRVTITNWFHPIDRVVAVLESPRRDLDADTAVVPRIAYINLDSSRDGNVFTTTSRWRRLPGRYDLPYDKFIVAGQPRYLLHGADRHRVGRGLALLAAGRVTSPYAMTPRITIDRVERVTVSQGADPAGSEVWCGNWYEAYVEEGDGLSLVGFGGRKS